MVDCCDCAGDGRRDFWTCRTLSKGMESARASDHVWADERRAFLLTITLFMSPNNNDAHRKG